MTNLSELIAIENRIKEMRREGDTLLVSQLEDSRMGILQRMWHNAYLEMMEKRQLPT